MGCDPTMSNLCGKGPHRLKIRHLWDFQVAQRISRNFLMMWTQCTQPKYGS